MTTTPESVAHVAKLARLELTPEETQRYTEDLNKILGMVEQLNELNLSDIAIELDVAQPTVLRPDQGIREFTRDELLANAPQEEDGFFRVPKILGDASN